MRKFFLIPLAGMAITACNAQSPSTDGVDVKALQAEIVDLKTQIDGKVLGTCEETSVLADISTYADSLADLPDAELESAEWHAKNAERKDVMVTPTGLQYTVVQKGTSNGVKPAETDTVRVHYHGVFTDGKKFDSSYDRGEPSEFRRNGVIKGWIEALGDMQPCEARTLYVPGDLAYGPGGRGSIPPNATLIFHVQLLGVKQVGLKEQLKQAQDESNQLRAFIQTRMGQ